VQAADAVVALHSTDPVSVFVSAWARMRDPGVAAVEHALYDERSLVRVMGMRRTLFAAPTATAATVLTACGRGVAANERRKLLAFLADDGVADPEAVVAEGERLTLDALRALGEATAPELGARDERLMRRVTLGRGTKYETTQSLVSRVLTVLGADGRAVRARPKGTWSSTQFRWAALDRWAPGAVPGDDVPAAQAELARRWLGAFGPAPATDLRWWTGWGARDTTAALAAAGAVEVDLGGTVGVALADDLEPTAPPEPWAALLPALDPTTMGWKDRGWYLGEHEGPLFDTTGNASPTVWWNGRVIGGWARRESGEIVFELLEDAGGEAIAAVDAEAERLLPLLGDVKLSPRARARSAVEKRLVG
jgi:hypothetical protein